MVYSKDERRFLFVTYLKGESMASVAQKFYERFNRRTNKMAVSRLVKKFEETNSLNNRIRKGSVRNTENTRRVLTSFQRSPTKSIRKGAAELGLAKETVRVILRKNKNIPYKIGHVQVLLEGDPERRYAFCLEMKTKF